MLVEALASWYDPTVYAQGFSCQKREADDCDIILVMSNLAVYIEGREYIRGSAHEFEAIIWVFAS